MHDIFGALADANARFVVIGGVALTLHGSSYVTEDIDLAYERTRENARRIATALQRFSPRPRGFPSDVPFIFDEQTLLSAEILTLETSAGDLDLLATVAGLGGFSEVDAAAQTMTLNGRAIRVLSVDGLIAAKTAAGREKDRPGLIELEALREARAMNEGTE
jgi:hypothetical protein